jgi:anaerobic selenocysteine-containing dehydrogenase
MEDVWRFYQAIPQWVGRPDDHAAAEYDLLAVNWATPQFRIGASDQTGNPLLNEVVDSCDPYQLRVLLHRETAERKGLRDGDQVVVEAYWGGMTSGTLMLTELMHPEAVGIPGGHGKQSMHRNPLARRGPNFNALLNTAEGTFDPLHGGIDLSPRVKIYKAGGDSTHENGQ